MPLAAVQALTGDVETGAHLNTAARFGLVEITPSSEVATYFVSALLDAALAPELDEAERVRLAGKAARYLLDATPGRRPEPLGLEIVRLAAQGQESQLAVEAGDPIAAAMLYQNRYREAEALCHRILALTEDLRILTTLALAQQRLGRDGFWERIERAVELLPTDRENLLPEALRDCAVTLSAHADILQDCGQLDEALRILESEVTPVLEQLGDVHSLLVARTNLASFLLQKDAASNAEHARELLFTARREARQLNIPEAGLIETILRQLGWEEEG